MRVLRTNCASSTLARGRDGRGTEHDQRPLRRHDHLGGAIERRRAGDRQLERVRRHHAHGIARLGGDVFRQLEQDRARPLLGCDAERLAHERRDCSGRDDLVRELGQRLHRGDDVDDLEARLPRGEDAFLTGDHHHRHRAHVREGGGSGEVERTRPEGGDAHAGLAGEAAMVAAMKPAACSWRVITSSIFEWRSDSTTSRFSSPGMPKMRSTPSFSRAATRRSDPFVIASGLWGFFGAAAACRR